MRDAQRGEVKFRKQKMREKESKIGCIDTPPSDPVPSVADVPVTLLPTEDVSESRRHASEIAAERFVTDGGCDSFEGTKTGIIGQMALCNYFPGNQTPDSEVRPDGDGGWDHEIKGQTWDAKTAYRHTEKPDLLVNAETRLRAEKFALINRLGKKTCRIVGYAPKKVVERQPIERNEYGGRYHRVSRNKITPFFPIFKG